jgi:hypothetical protein
LPQALVVPATQAPLPLQREAVACDPLEHVAVRQTVPDGQSAHAALWQRPVVPQLEAAVAAHWPRGSALPFDTAAQSPSVPPVNCAEQA